MADETYSVRGRTLWVLTALLLLLPSFSGGSEPQATGFFYRSWETADGLPGNTVNRVVQDRRGFIWLANIGGVIRFDGVEFKLFDSPLTVQGSMRNIRALALEDESTLVMLPATGGVVRWHDGTFSPHPVGGALADWNLQTLFVDPSGAVWIGAPDGRIVRWKNGDVTKFGAVDGLRGSALRASFAADREGRVWIAAGDFIGSYLNGKLSRVAGKIDVTGPVVLASNAAGGLWISHGSAISKLENGIVTSVLVDLPWTALHGAVDALLEDREGALWIGTHAHGLYHFAGGKLSEVPTSQSEIRSIYEDRDGAIWVGTAGGGVNRLRPRLFRLFNTGSGLPEQVSAAVCEDPSGDVWLANRGGGIVRLHAGQIQPSRLQFDGRPLGATTLCAGARGAIWFSDDTVYRFEPTTSIVEKSAETLPRANVLYQARNGDIWVGAETNVLGRFRGGDIRNFTRENSFPGASVRAIAEDPSGRIWIGTERGDLFEFSENKFTRFGVDAGFPNAPVRAIYADRAGNIWVGTIGAGLVLRRKEHFVQFAGANGLSAESISEILEDDAGRIWLGSLRGLSYVPKRELLAFADRSLARVHDVTFGESDGLPRISFYGSSQPMMWQGANGTLWFTTQQGVLALDANALKSDSRPPPVYVDAVLVNDQAVPVGVGGAQLTPLPRKLEFRFAVLNYAAPETARLRYRLEGVDSEWIETTGRSAVYGQLRPGSYRLHATACSNEGIWNEKETVVGLTIPPVWWETLWARTSALVLFTAAVILGVRQSWKRKLTDQLRHLEREQALHRERSRIARDLHDDLGSSLTQIGLMLEELRETSTESDEIKAQSGAISGRVRLLAQDLNSVVWTINPKNDSLPDLVDHLSRYFLQNLRLSAIRPRLEVTDNFPHLPLSPEARHHLFLVVKEGINNVIKHSQATEAILALRFTDEKFEVTLRDNGVGFAPDAPRQSNRHGVQNMRSRIVELGGTFEVSSAPGQGTLLRIAISVKPSVPA